MRLVQEEEEEGGGGRVCRGGQTAANMAHTQRTCGRLGLHAPSEVQPCVCVRD